ncbi:uncharacterized protein LOC100123317 isoform X2 [Nasonia vitripennis]|uniref:BTB domain-containing protein n=1 Tax=Nasonia vitripennis TaxID=7425 RepID=A0A7M7LS24_NASVI|nr:uncharacterized protein LOC100123317 isoform X2 [Nasonia vitripennis]
MAGSSGGRIKQDGSLVRARLSLSPTGHSRLYRKYKTIKSRCNDHRDKQESKLLYLRHINLLQQDVERIFNESLYCDLKIIHKYQEIHTNQCIVRVRAPCFYDVIKPYFSVQTKTAHCYVKQFGTYLHIKHFVRLLHTNRDVSEYEKYVIQLILISQQRKHTYDKAINFYMNYCYGDVATKSLNDKSSSSSEMADSGLETGSMVSPQETISENSSTDLDEPNEAKILARSDDDIVYAEACLPRRKFPGPIESSRVPRQMRDEISDYENRVLSDPFYDESDDDDDDDGVGSYVPTSSFEFEKPSALLLAGGNSKKNDDKLFRADRITQNGKKPNINISQHVDNSASSNYYFIDASSLNDDPDVTTPGAGPHDVNGRLAWPTTQAPVGCYIPTSRSNNFIHNDDTFKLCSRKSRNAQNHYEETAEFQTDLKLNEFLEPLAEPRKLKKQELVNDELSNTKSANKESLVVEIKEADSGESAQHSPCPDNTKLDNAQKVQEKLSRIDSEQRESDDEEEQEQEQEQAKQEDDPERRPSLIRRNTFELDANDEKLSSLRQEYERRQGTLVFQNSITQYSSHRVDDDSFFDVTAQSDSMLLDLEPPQTQPILDVVRNKYDLDNAEKESKSLSLARDDALVRSASDKLLATSDDEDISFSSLPVTINEDLSTMSPASKSKLRRNEAAPIVSGGASTADFRKATDSPIVKRKTESTPIVSGGSIILPELTKPRPKPTLSSSTTAWVVDMSDCRSNSISEKPLTKRRSAESQISTSATNFSPWTEANAKEEKQHSSLGYFVNLDDIKSPKEKPKGPFGGKHRRRPSDTGSEKNYCEFFVDLSDNKPAPARSSSVVNKKKEDDSVKAVPNAMAMSQPSDSKKNIFSMFIELGQTETTSGRSVAKSSSSSTLADKRYELTQSMDQMAASATNGVSEERKPKSGVFMFIESDSPIVRRRTLSSSRPAFKRHSWNTDKVNELQNQPQTPTQTTPQSATSIAASKRMHKRAQSLSVDRCGDLRKMLGHKSSNSSHSLNESAMLQEQQKKQEEERQQQEEQQQTQQPDLMEDSTFDYDTRDTPPNSHVEIMNDELLMSLKNRNFQELDAINEQTSKETRRKSTQQDDGCSESSVWDKTPTESTENNQTRKSETFDVISSSASGPSSASDNLDFKLADLIDATQQKLAVSSKVMKNHQDNRLHQPSHDKATKSNGKVGPPASFVRLSDLDKRPHGSSATSSMIVTTSHESSYRLSNSVTETSWIESKLVMTSRTNEPLHRTLTKKLSLSMGAGPTRSDNYDEFGNEADAEAVVSESDISSLQSSMGRSGQGSTEETETSTSFALGKPYNRLGEDLLRMFLEEINPDVTIDVGGRRIRAHKCILSSRCQYFAAILSGGWIESAGNIISLQGYSYNAVHFALCHIYSGESCIPDSISIVELATLADMLCLEGLKEVIGFTLKVKYCHLFHKPCNGCAVGVLECMPLAAAYGLDEVYRKSLRWVTRHFVRIWPCKEFATLPRELMDKCYHQHIVHMCADNVLQTIMDCDKLLTTLPNVRWAEPVFRLASNLLDASMKYLTDNFASVLGNESFQGLDRELTWNISRLEDHLLAAAERLPPEQACKSYAKLDKMFNTKHTTDPQRMKTSSWSPLFMTLMTKIRAQVEKCLIRDAARAARTNAWLKMDLELRRHIQELACLVILPNDPPNKRPSRHSNFLKEPKERQEQKIPTSRTPPNRNLDLRRVKMAISEHNDRTLKQTPLLQTRKIMNKPKTDPLERKSQNEKLTSDTSSISRPKSWPNKMEVKSRYLEPRNRPTSKESVPTNQEKNLSQQRRKIMISSSDSSRTSSPAMKRAAEKKGLMKSVSKVPMKKDGKALSSDSLTESGSRLSLKKDSASKSLGITRPESPQLKVKEASIEPGLSIDSLADSKKKPVVKKPNNKMDTSMSTDSLMTDVTAITTPKSMATNKSSPVLGKTATNSSINQTRNYERLKKSSPPTQQRNINNTTSSTRKPARSLESSTAASRSRAAAVVDTYRGSLNLRKSLLDAAKAPDIPSRVYNSAAMTRTNLRQSSQSMRSSFAGSNKNEKKDDVTGNNQRSNSSPGSKRSPKSNITSRLTKSTIVTAKQKPNKIEDKSSNKAKSQAGDGPKFLNQSSRSGTFLKDEPTILNKSDIETAAIDV